MTSLYMQGSSKSEHLNTIGDAEDDSDVLIECKDVYKSFGEKKILNGVNFKVKSYHCFCFFEFVDSAHVCMELVNIIRKVEAVMISMTAVFLKWEGLTYYINMLITELDKCFNFISSFALCIDQTW